MMVQLLKKDWRVYRVAIIGNLVFVLFMYGIVLGSALLSSEGKLSSVEVSDAFTGAAASSIMVTVVLASVYGASAFAIERRERSANFLAMLPVQRSKILASKLIVAWSAIIAFVLVNILVIVFVNWDRGLLNTPVGEVLGDLAAWLIFSFGVAWMLSTVMESAPLVFGITIGIVFGTFVVVEIYMLEFPVDKAAVEKVLACCAFVVGLACAASGSIYYLWRIEP